MVVTARGTRKAPMVITAFPRGKHHKIHGRYRAEKTAVNTIKFMVITARKKQR